MNAKRIIIFVFFFTFIEYFLLGNRSFFPLGDHGDSIVGRLESTAAQLHLGRLPYWSSFLAAGTDRLGMDHSIFRLPQLLHSLFPGWLAFQIFLLIQIFLGFIFVKKIGLKHLGLSFESASFASLFFVISGIHVYDFILGFSSIPFLLYTIEELLKKTNLCRRG